jgi:predicted nucleic acid-binding protein
LQLNGGSLRRRKSSKPFKNTLAKSLLFIPVVLCSLTVAEVGHGIYRANSPEIRNRRRAFLDELKATVPIYPVTEATAEIVARIGGEEAAKGILLPLGDLIIGACALELGYGGGTGNLRDFSRIPGLTVVPL